MNQYKITGAASLKPRRRSGRRRIRCRQLPKRITPAAVKSDTGIIVLVSGPAEITA